jgi:hypothetical protein
MAARKGRQAVTPWDAPSYPGTSGGGGYGWLLLVLCVAGGLLVAALVAGAYWLCRRAERHRIPGLPRDGKGMLSRDDWAAWDHIEADLRSMNHPSRRGGRRCSG